MQDNGFSVGVDIERVERFKDIFQKEHSKFLKMIYTKKEINYCFSKSNPSEHLAARFAGKEAIIKVLSGFGIRVESILPRDIEILRGVNGRPEVKINLEGTTNLTIEISLSHSTKNAIALASGRRNEQQ